MGASLDSRLSYAVGAFNGVSDGGSNDIESTDDEKDIAARVFATPFVNRNVSALRGLGFGIAWHVRQSRGRCAVRLAGPATLLCLSLRPWHERLDGECDRRWRSLAFGASGLLLPGTLRNLC